MQIEIGEYKEKNWAFRYPVYEISISNGIFKKEVNYLNVHKIETECTTDMELNFCNLSLSVTQENIEQFLSDFVCGNKIEVKLGYYNGDNPIRIKVKDYNLSNVFSGRISRIIFKNSEQNKALFKFECTCYDCMEELMSMREDVQIKPIEIKGVVDEEGKLPPDTIKNLLPKSLSTVPPAPSVKLLNKCPIKSSDYDNKYAVVASLFEEGSDSFAFIDVNGKCVINSFERMAVSSEDVYSFPSSSSEFFNEFVKGISFSKNYMLPKYIMRIGNDENETQTISTSFGVGKSNIKISNFERIGSYCMPIEKNEIKNADRIRLTRDAMKVIKGTVTFKIMLPGISHGKFFDVKEFMCESTEKGRYYITKVKHMFSEREGSYTACVLASTPQF